MYRSRHAPAAADAGSVTVLQWLTALMPVLAVAVLLVGLRLPASRAMPLALLITSVLTLLVWRVPGRMLSAAVLVSGGATFSHLMFAQLQADVATDIGARTGRRVGPAGRGRERRNMVCVANVVAVAGVTGQLGKEGAIISRTVLPVLVYVGGSAVLGFLLVALF